MRIFFLFILETPHDQFFQLGLHRGYCQLLPLRLLGRLVSFTLGHFFLKLKNKMGGEEMKNFSNPATKYGIAGTALAILVEVEDV